MNASAASELRVFQVFRAGTHKAMSGDAIAFSESDVSAIAAGYDVARQSAPLVLGHPADNGGALGKVISLVAAQGALFAVAEVSRALIDLVRSGRFKQVSSSFHTPGSANNPTPGTHYLRHVGFLGAMPPAVRNMQALSFCESADFADFSTGAASPVNQRHRIHAAAQSLLQAVPTMPYIEAASRIERALNRP